MGVGFQVGGVIDEVGSAEFLNAFFSTISHHLEPGGWGSEYPELMNELYQGRLEHRHAEAALQQVLDIREKLRSLPPSAIVWDGDNKAAKPPWGENISTDITDLSNYFVTSSGRDLFEVLIECLQALIEEGGFLKVVPI